MAVFSLPMDRNLSCRAGDQTAADKTGTQHVWQGRRDLNPQPSVLETDALPIELHPCGTNSEPLLDAMQLARTPATAVCASGRTGNAAIYSTIFVTTPDPTVRPPSRIAKRTPSSMAIGLWSSTEIFTLSPGMHISASTRLAVPVTSVVRK